MEIDIKKMTLPDLQEVAENMNLLGLPWLRFKLRKPRPHCIRKPLSPSAVEYFRKDGDEVDDGACPVCELEKCRCRKKSCPVCSWRIQLSIARGVYVPANIFIKRLFRLEHIERARKSVEADWNIIYEQTEPVPPVVENFASGFIFPAPIQPAPPLWLKNKPVPKDLRNDDRVVCDASSRKLPPSTKKYDGTGKYGVPRLFKGGMQSHFPRAIIGSAPKPTDESAHFDRCQFDPSLRPKHSAVGADWHEQIGEPRGEKVTNLDLLIASLVGERFAGVGATDEECKKETPSETERARERRENKRRRAHALRVELASLVLTTATADDVFAAAFNVDPRTIRRRRHALTSSTMTLARWQEAQGMSDAARRDLNWCLEWFATEDDGKETAALCPF